MKIGPDICRRGPVITAVKKRNLRSRSHIDADLGLRFIQSAVKAGLIIPEGTAYRNSPVSPCRFPPPAKLRVIGNIHSGPFKLFPGKITLLHIIAAEAGRYGLIRQRAFSVRQTHGDIVTDVSQLHRLPGNQPFPGETEMSYRSETGENRHAQALAEAGFIAPAVLHKLSALFILPCIKGRNRASVRIHIKNPVHLAGYSNGIRGRGIHGIRRPCAKPVSFGFIQHILDFFHNSLRILFKGPRKEFILPACCKQQLFPAFLIADQTDRCCPNIYSQ